LGELAAALEGEREVVRTRLSNFGKLLTALMLEQTGADLAVINGGSIRASIVAGRVTLGDILSALPFPNRIMTLELSGSEIERMLAYSLEQRKRTDSGGFLQVAGLAYQSTDAGPTAIQIGGQPLDPFKLYKVALTDFLYHGGDGHDVFRTLGRNPTDTGLLLAPLLAEFIRTHSPFTAPNP
jgi:2',3'-cyclic-nucleotide 2'-phosphodiesterase (5'-nucleotidase family)